MSFGYVVESSAQGSGPNGWNYKWAEPTSVTLRREIQDGLRRLGRYSGPVDGVWGPETIKGIQRTIQAQNLYSGPVDGAVGKNTVIGVINYAYHWRRLKTIEAYEPWPALFISNGDTWGEFRARLVN